MIFMSCNEAITCQLQIITYAWLWRKNQGAEGYKGSTMMQALQLLWLWKGKSQDEMTLISEEIESVALDVLELCLSEGISK